MYSIHLRMDGRTDRRMNERTDVYSDGRTMTGMMDAARVRPTRGDPVQSQHSDQLVLFVVYPQ